ncbi:MAG: peroxiredoxin family protein [Gammaproteobacteria bacterium]|nr:peroxiredoxin family protein [Gammaproteobacteria bacterium]
MKNSEFSKQRRQFVTRTAVALAGSTFILQTNKALAQSDSRYGILGTPAPEISLDYWIDKDGEPGSFSVMENRGKWVFLKCFQNWCPGCHSGGFPTLKKFSDEFWDHPKVAIAGIQTVFEGYNSNTLEDVRKLQLRYELPITMGHDPGNPDDHTRPQTMQKYRTGGTPWLILISPDGLVAYNDYHVNADKLVEYIWKQAA